LSETILYVYVVVVNRVCSRVRALFKLEPVFDPVEICLLELPELQTPLYLNRTILSIYMIVSILFYQTLFSQLFFGTVPIELMSDRISVESGCSGRLMT
jgi:hypothetical protein